MPFAERSLEVVVDLYHKTACHKAVITEKVLESIIKVIILFMHQLPHSLLQLTFYTSSGVHEGLETKCGFLCVNVAVDSEDAFRP